MRKPNPHGVRAAAAALGIAPRRYIALADLPGEVWRPIPGWEGQYSASSLGRVRSEARTITAGRAARAIAPRILRPRLDGADGYITTALSRGGVRHPLRLHTAVLLAHVGPRPPRHQCCHHDGTRTNARLENLRWATPAENAADARRHGRIAVGERHGGSKLTAADVVAIRATLEPARVIAARLGVTARAVLYVRQRATWQHVAETGAEGAP